MGYPAPTQQKASSARRFAASHQCVLCPRRPPCRPCLALPRQHRLPTTHPTPQQAAARARQPFRSSLCLIHPSYCKSFPPDGSDPSPAMPAPPDCRAGTQYGHQCPSPPLHQPGLSEETSPAAAPDRSRTHAARLSKDLEDRSYCCKVQGAVR